MLLTTYDGNFFEPDIGMSLLEWKRVLGEKSFPAKKETLGTAAHVEHPSFSRSNLLKLPKGANNMWQFWGYVPKKEIIQSLDFARRNLADASDDELLQIQQDLVQIVAQDVLGLHGFEQKGFGIITHSGSESNKLALTLAKRKTGKNLVLMTNLAHTSAKDSFSNMEIITIDADFHNGKYSGVNLLTLENAIRKHQHQLAAIVDTVGTTLLGTHDNLATGLVQEAVRKHNIWYHVDAAFGGWDLLNRPAAQRVYPLCIPSYTNSISIDTHKFVGPADCGILLLKKEDGKLLGSETEYFKGVNTILGTTRSAMPAAATLNIIKSIGVDGLVTIYQELKRRTSYLQNELTANGFELIAPANSRVIPILMKDQNEVTHFRESLHNKGFDVGPIIINGRNWNNSQYQIHGLRVVVSPIPEMNYHNLHAFVQVIKDIRTF